MYKARSWQQEKPYKFFSTKLQRLQNEYRTLFKFLCPVPSATFYQMLFTFLISLFFVPISVVLYALANSRLNAQFNQSSITFKILYAVYNSFIGPYYHGYLLAFKADPGKRHTVKCREPDDYGHFIVWYVPYLNDNYAYFIVDKRSGQVACVDGADPDFIRKEFEVLKMYTKESLITLVPLKLTCVLTTHYHQDHAGGNGKLCSMFGNLDIVSGVNETCLKQNIALNHLQYYKLGKTSIQILNTPCHTKGHVGFYIESSVKSRGGAFFSGDAIFVGGCGKFFEGDGTVMYDTISNVLLKHIPKNTKLYCGHEYTVSNLKFALKIEPKNLAIQEKLKWALEQRSKSLPTVPSTFEDELKYNIFLRYDSEALLKTLNLKDRNVSKDIVLEKLRRYKDTGKLL